MISQSKERQMNDLGFISDSHYKLSTKLAIISFYNVNYPKIIEIILSLVEYLQLLSQIILLVLESTFKDVKSQENFFIRGLYIFCQIFSPFCSLSYNDKIESTLILAILFSITCYLIIKHVIYLYVVGKSFHNATIHPFIVNIWRWIYKAQGRLLYFVISSFWVALTRAALKNDLGAYGLPKTTLVIVCSVLLTIEFASSLYFLLGYVSILPTKNFLSEKNNHTQLITLTQKLLLQVLQISLVSNISDYAWIFCAICIIIDIIRNIHHYTVLPFYRIQALFYQGIILMIISSLNLSWLAQIVLNSADSYYREEFVWITWAFLAYLSIKISNIYLKRSIYKIVTKPTVSSPQLLIHKIMMIKQITKIVKEHDGKHDTYQFWLLLEQTINTNLRTILGIGSEVTADEELVNPKEMKNKLFFHYLEALAVKFPKNNLLKLHLAYFCTKKLRKYGKAVKIAMDLKKSNQRLIDFNASILLLDIQNFITSKYEDSNTKINLAIYAVSQSHFVQLKRQAIKQTVLQVQLCQELISEAPRLLKILEWSQLIHKYQVKIEVKIKKMMHIIPDYFVEPLAFLAHYYFGLNHSLSDSVKYQKLYTAKFEKYKKFFGSDTLQLDNLYQSHNAFMILSAHKADAGTILFCTKAAENIYGGDARLLIGKHISSVAPPPLQSMTLLNFKTRVQKESQQNFDQILRGYGWHKEGYMIEVDYYMNIFPFVNKGFCFGTIIRKTNTNQDCLLINQNGNIECATKNIIEKLGLKSSSKFNTNIKVLSEELNRANNAFNRLALVDSGDYLKNDYGEFQLYTERNSDNHQKSGSKGEIDIETVQIICEVYRKEGKEISLKSTTNNKKYLYHCNISQLFFDNSIKRMVFLKPIKEDKAEEHREDQISFATKNNFELKKSDSEDSNFFQVEDEIKSELDKPSSPNKLTRPGKSDTSRTFFENMTTKKFVLEKQYTESSNLLSPVSPGVNIGQYKTMFSFKAPFKDPNLGDQIFEEEVPSAKNPLNENKEKGVQIRQYVKTQKAEGSVADSRMSKSFKQIKVSKVFKEAIAIKSYHKYFKVSTITFYVILVGIFAIQLNIMLTWADNLDALKVKKDILNNSLLRNYYTTDLPLYFALIMGIDSGKFDFSLMGIGITDIIGYLESERSLLVIANNVLLADTNSLSEDLRKKLFYKDVRVFDLCLNCTKQPYMIVNHFQATNIALEFSLRLEALMSENVSAQYDKANLYFNNNLNDLMLKNDEIAKIFLQSLDDQQNEILNNAKIFFITSLALLSLNAIIMVSNIWSQHSAEIQNLMAFTKVSSAGVNDVLKKLHQFQSMLENQENFEEWLIQDFDDQKHMHLDFIMNKQVKISHQQKIDSKGLVKKYHFHFARITCAILILCGLTFWSNHAVQIFIENIYEKQSQLYFLNTLRSRTNLIGESAHQLLANGPLGTIENVPILSFLSKSIYELVNFRAQLPGVFSIKNMEKNSKVYDVLFGDGCPYFHSGWIPYCIFLKDNGIQPSLMELITIYEKMVLSFHERYMSLNGTEQFLFRLSDEEFNMFFTIYGMLTGASPFHLMEIIDKIYEAMLIDSKDQRDMIFKIFTVTLGFIMILFWVLVLRDLKEVYNRFKQVLKTLPPELILSNFFLKMFLSKTSRGIIDFVKNGM